MRLLANQESRSLAILRFAPALRVRAGRRLAERKPSRPQSGGSSMKRSDEMAQIGTFTKGDNGSLNGTIKTLTLNVKATIRPADKDNDKAPDYRVFAGTVEFGAAWKKTSREDREYLSVKLDDPSFAAPIYASLVESEGGEQRLIWSR
jgi:uncharacterized protein (DUF736 family)